MCLIIKKGEVERTATEDMVVYKVITQNNKSVYQDFQYEPNTLYRLRKKLKVVYGGIDEGFHSYRNFEIACNDILVYGYDKIVKFVIPKGAKYYLGINDEIVSTSIKSGSLKSIKYKGK